ncbi:T9SS type A sorting domain-containing protein [Winogradskyella vidalii]|uniref:T9SS type A sorting domain-containing protein n=1 Tax=Winogradskyella vidalii TaxID=2615024 RepID=UPI0015CE9C10|nr:T9SS type A sorting domain-containing protein [Winogradskyella vidalii]
MMKIINLLNMRCDFKLLLLTIFLICFSQSFLAQQLAFPTAYGAGAYTTGGRGGEVVHVTNLNDSGEGSLRWALTDASNISVSKTIIFDVSGVINLSSDIILSGESSGGTVADGLTFAGQSAPLGGITITGGKIRMFSVNNVIARYLKFRETTAVDGCFSNTNGNNIIYDHLSGSHSPDIVFALVSSERITVDKTFQNCLVGQSLNALIIGDSSPPNGDDGGDYSVLRNAYYNISHRIPFKGGGAIKADAINNIAHNWSARLLRMDHWNYTLNHIGNRYEIGYNSTNQLLFCSWNNRPEYTPSIYNLDNYLTPGSFNNYSRPEGYEEDESLAWSEFQNNYSELPSDWFTSTQHPIKGRPIPILSSSELKSEVLPLVGACQYIKDDGSVGFYRDTYDTEFVNGIDTDDTSSRNTTIDLPIISLSNTRPENFYVSNPHIPEVWFAANVPEGQDHNDIAPSGYTWLEEYLNQVDGDNSVAAIGVESIDVTPETSELQLPDTLQLEVVFTPTDATNINGAWSSSDESLATVDTNGLVTPISEGEVTITFTTAQGGFSDTSVITVFPEALLASAGTNQQICEGESTTLTASGGDNYLWSTGETTETIEVSPVETTVYTVTVSDDAGQSEEASVTVTVNTLPEASAGENQTICVGDTVNLIATGGTTYLWNTGETTASIEVNPTVETVYTVEVSNENCSSTAEVTVSVNDLPNIILSEDVVIVEGESTTLTASGSDNYEWSTGETTESITVTPIATSTYSVSTIGVNGCLNNAEVTVTVVPEMNISISEAITICSGEDVTLTATGGVNYTWSTGDLGAELSVSPTTTSTYTVTVEDEYGFTATDSVTVTVNELPNISLGDDIFIMVGNSATLTASGGTTYVWSTGETSTEIIVSPEVTSTYTVTGDSENGCQNTAEITVTVIETLNADAGEDAIICLGESITLDASGGISYTWNTGATGATPTVSPTETTTYSVTVTDGYGNSDTDEVIITVNPAPTVNAGEDQYICPNEAITLTATSENGDSYLWSTGETSASITVSPTEDTTYTVQAFNATCAVNDEVTVNILPIPELTLTDNVSIVAGNSAELVAAGGDSYLWNTGVTTSTISVSPLETTTYTVTAYLEGGCELTSEVTVTVIPEVIANAGNDVEICFGESASLNASGGVSYLWNTGGTGATPTVSPSETTTYTVTVSDDFGNTDSDSVTVTVNDLPDLLVNDAITILEGESTNLTVSGAETYLWSTGETSNSIIVNPTETTTYSVTGLSSSGCESVENVTVTVIPLVIASAGNDVEICSGESVTLNASGGTGYAWDTGQTTNSITVSPTATTTYTVLVSNDFGNTDSASVTVTVNESPDIYLSENITIIEGESTSLLVEGADSYLWNTGETSSSITVSPTQTTTYSVVGTSNSCNSVLAEVTVTVIPVFVTTAGEDTYVCDNQTYEVVLTAGEGDTHLWSTGETTQSIVVSPLSTTTYTVTVTQEEQIAEDEVVVNVDPSPVVTIANGESVEILQGDFVTLTASGANTYEWNNGASQPNIAVSPNTTTTYEVKGYIGECYDEKQVTVNVLQPVFADAGEDVFICLGETTTLTASGGDDYVWSTGDTTASIEVSPDVTTDYTVTVFNALDFEEATVTVEVDANCLPEDGNPGTESVDFTYDIYPNPASEVVNIRLSGTLNVSDIYMFDVTGKLIKRTNITNENLSATTTQIDISTLQPGVYFIKLIDDERNITKKLIVE